MDDLLHPHLNKPKSNSSSSLIFLLIIIKHDIKKLIYFIFFRNEDTRYICEFCNKVFSRRVTLKKHMEEHEKSSSGPDSELSDNEVEDDPTITENKNDDDDKPEKENS